MIIENMKKAEEDIIEDPAEAYPWKRYTIRNFITNFGNVLIYSA